LLLSGRLRKVTEDDHEKVKTLGVPFENRSRYVLNKNHNRFCSNLFSDIYAKASVVLFSWMCQKTGGRKWRFTAWHSSKVHQRREVFYVFC